MEDPYSRELEVAAAAVRRAVDEHLRPAAGGAEEKENPVGSYDLVTCSDREVQDKIAKAISSEFPEDLFIAEEGEENSLTDARTWVIDPIDGTLNFERGIPAFGSQLALMVGREPVLSVIHLPPSGETFTARLPRGSGSTGSRWSPAGGGT